VRSNAPKLKARGRSSGSIRFSTLQRLNTAAHNLRSNQPFDQPRTLAFPSSAPFASATPMPPGVHALPSAVRCATRPTSKAGTIRHPGHRPCFPARMEAGRALADHSLQRRFSLRPLPAVTSFRFTHAPCRLTPAALSVAYVFRAAPIDSQKWPAAFTRHLAIDTSQRRRCLLPPAIESMLQGSTAKAKPKVKMA